MARTLSVRVGSIPVVPRTFTGDLLEDVGAADAVGALRGLGRVPSDGAAASDSVSAVLTPAAGPIATALDITASNVGPRIALTPYSGDWNVASQGSPAGRDVSGRITFNVSGTYRDFRARNGVYAAASNVVMEYFELGPDSGNATNFGTGCGAIWGDYTMRYGKIHNFSDGLRLNGGLVEWCWIYNLTQQDSGDHNDGIQTTEGSNVTIRGSRISRTEGFIQTSCLMMAADQGNVSNVLIEKNLFESNPGFQVCLYWGHGGSWTATGCTIRDNYFTNTFNQLLSANDPYVASGNRWVTGSTGNWTPGALITALNNA